MRRLATIIVLTLLCLSVRAQQDAFSLRLGPEIGGGLGHQWGSDIDYNNGMLSGGLMFEGRMADAWGWALRPAYARSVAFDEKIGTAFGADRVQLLTGPVWRADNGRTMRAYARTAPFVRLLGGAVSAIDVTGNSILPMAELGLGLKFRLNDRNDIEMALAAQGAGTGADNLQLAGMLSLAYHINFKERRIKFRSAPLNLIPRSNEEDMPQAKDWETPFVPGRAIEWPEPDAPAAPSAKEGALRADPAQTSASAEKADTPASADKPDVATEDAVREQTDAVSLQPASTQVEEVREEETVTEGPVVQQKKDATPEESVRTEERTVGRPQESVAPEPRPTTGQPRSEPVNTKVIPSEPRPSSPPQTTSGRDPVTEQALQNLAMQQEKMMAMLQELMREMREGAARTEAQRTAPASAQPQPQYQQTAPAPHPSQIVPAGVNVVNVPSADEEVRKEVTRLSVEMARMAERMQALEERIAQQGAGLPSPVPEAVKGTVASAALPEKTTSEKEEAAVPVATGTGHEVQFAKNSYGLNADQTEILREMALRVIADNRLMAVVEGYADRTGPAEYNAIIARKRAQQVLYELKRLGVPLSQTVFASYGDERSLDDPSYRKVVVRIMRPE